LKNDSKKLLYDIEDLRKYDEFLKEKDLLVAASTHEGEEFEIINKFKSLLIELPNLFLVIAPRHPDRRNDLVKIIKQSGFNDKEFILRSNNDDLDQNIKIFLLDSIGELGYFYKKANTVILGGAFGDFGGHNPIEPALFDNAIFSGPNFYNFKDEYNLLSKAGGVKIIYDMDDLFILKNKEKILSMAKNSKIFSENIGGAASKISVKLIGMLNENY
jgi:3-deoxy-D-manno-octulosonic-acid transferase